MEDRIKENTCLTHIQYRLSEVWLDEYKEYFNERLNDITVNIGDISKGSLTSHIGMVVKNLNLFVIATGCTNKRNSKENIIIS